MRTDGACRLHGILSESAAGSKTGVFGYQLWRLEGEVWAILGTSAFEVRLLLEIIANARPYKDGRCVLAQKGMMRKKEPSFHMYII